MKTSAVSLRAGLLPSLLASASLVQPAAAAVEGPPTVLECGHVGEFVAGWMIAGEPYARLVVHGVVRELSTVGDTAYTVICGRQPVEVVCVEQSVAGLSIGDAVILEGVVSRADGSELVLDPCGAILRK